MSITCRSPHKFHFCWPHTDCISFTCSQRFPALSRHESCWSLVNSNLECTWNKVWTLHLLHLLLRCNLEYSRYWFLYFRLLYNER